MSNSIFSSSRYLDGTFMMQLPYLNDLGSPLCVDITPHDAERLVITHKTHRCMTVSENLFVLTPIVTAQQNVEFQIGEPRI